MLSKAISRQAAKPQGKSTISPSVPGGVADWREVWVWLKAAAASPKYIIAGAAARADPGDLPRGMALLGYSVDWGSTSMAIWMLPGGERSLRIPSKKWSRARAEGAFRST